VCDWSATNGNLTSSLAIFKLFHVCIALFHLNYLPALSKGGKSSSGNDVVSLRLSVILAEEAVAALKGQFVVFQFYHH
jgi:hypothetical protein